MKRWARSGAVLAAVVLAGASEQAQTVVNPSGQRIVLAGQEGPALPVADTRKLTDKQRVLANQADLLLQMATELKQQVDMTNKNILSIKVVRKAEEIEFYARRMKGEAKK